MEKKQRVFQRTVPYLSYTVQYNTKYITNMLMDVHNVKYNITGSIKIEDTSYSLAMNISKSTD